LKDRDVSKIDYKVALFEVRETLKKKSAEGLAPHIDLGIEEEVASNEDARKRMLQLRAAAKLIDLTLDLKIPKLVQIEPLEPQQHRVEKTGEVYLEEYPVRMLYSGTMQNCADLFRAILESSHAFVIRRLRFEKRFPPESDLINVDATLSALVFLRNPEELSAPPSSGPKTMRPVGH